MMEEAEATLMSQQKQATTHIHETDITKLQQFLQDISDPLNEFTDEEVSIIDGSAPPSSVEECDADAK
jgi:uncharacterized protein YbaP (TraB family)